MGSGTAVAAVSTQQAKQATLVSTLEGPLDAAWQLLDPRDPQSVNRFLAAIVALARSFGRISASEAAKYYEAVRVAEGVPGAFVARPAPPATPDEILAGARWAIQGLWGPNPDSAAARSLLTGVVERNVLEAGRTTILDAAQRDRRCKGWARETEPGCCSFCAMLATRGAVYRSESSGDFASHNNCRCFAVPVFGTWEPSAEVAEWQQLYKESTRGVHGARRMRKAFRDAYEARSKTK